MGHVYGVVLSFYSPVLSSTVQIPIFSWVNYPFKVNMSH